MQSNEQFCSLKNKINKNKGALKSGVTGSYVISVLRTRWPPNMDSFDNLLILLSDDLLIVIKLLINQRSASIVKSELRDLDRDNPIKTAVLEPGTSAILSILYQ